MKKQLLGIAAGLALAFNASALMITPSTMPQITGNDNSNLSASQISALLGITVTELYKDNVGGSETGSFGPYYETTYYNTPSDPMDADIVHYGGPNSLAGYANLWLYVKDGNHDPAFYLISLAGWNGTDTLELRGFWPNGGAISHVAILGGEGTTIMLLGAGLAGLGAVRRFIKV